ncbi:hypothetical protein RHGRI_021039 [Rhododendron griersonianum]|uniref:Ubiquitin-like protease family profile domain-containing protein n=1 Tax=Rhododendron griersonianum TaxID=479676 RepID=A0AAV6JLZ3_9ERIC|nr:hypothetical protein RHGRI_021039 [Rhododendron griersonianum]
MYYMCITGNWAFLPWRGGGSRNFEKIRVQRVELAATACSSGVCSVPFEATLHSYTLKILHLKTYVTSIFLLFLYAVVRGKGKAKQLDSISDEEDTKEQTCDEEVSKGIIETDTIPNPPKKLKTKKLAGRKPIEVTSSSVPKAEFSKRHAQSQYDFRVRSPKNQGINIDQAAPQSQPLRKRPRIVVETQETQATEASQHIAFNRCNMQAMIRLMKGFPVTPALKDSLKKTPFWHLINAFIVEKVKSDHCRKFDEVVVKIVESYDANTRTFRLGNKHVKLEREDVKLIFGITCGNEEINQGYCKKEDVQLAVKWKIKGNRLDTSTIKKLLTEKQNSKLEEDMDDIARLLCLFLCGTLFFSTSGTTINWVYVRHMEDLNKIKQFDWAGAICKYLLRSTHVEHKDPKEVKGSSILLLYWLCEHSNIPNQESPDSIPRLLKWNIAKLRKALKDVKQLQQLPDEKVKDGTLEQTIEEKVESEFEQHGVQQDLGDKDEVNQHEVKNDEFVDVKQLQQLLDEKIQDGTLEQTIEEKVESEFEQHEVQQDQVQQDAGEKDEGDKVEVAEVENVPDSCGLDDFDTPTAMFHSPLCSGEIDESQAVSFRRDEVTSPKYTSDSTLEPNTLSGKSLTQEEDECLKKLVDNILDDSKKYAQIEYLEKQMEIEKQSNKDALAVIDELRKEKDSITNDMSAKIERLENDKNQMEIEKESICEPLNDKIAKLKKLVESQDKQIIMLKDVMSKGPLTTMHELKNQNQSSEKDLILIDKVESLEKEKKELELQKLKMQEDNEIVIQSKDHQITTLERALARKIEETEEEMKNQIKNLDKQNKKLCLAKDRYIQTLLNKASVLEKQKAKQQDVNNALQMQIDEFKIHEVTQRYADETEGAVHQVTQKATIEKIRRLEREKEELELELLDIRVHEDRQKREAEKSLISPNSNIIALKARERKKNTDEDFVYEEVKKKTKTGKELFMDVDDLKSQEDERQKTKLRKLKANAEVAMLLSRESWMAIETLWNTADMSTEVWSSKDELMHVTAHDIQMLLFESALSTRCVDAYMNILMQQHVDQQPTFILETQQAKSFVFPSFFVRKLIADYINSDSKSSAGKGIENTVHIERCSPQQPDGFVECGVVVIFLMKQYLMNQERSKVISIEECRKTRAEMIHAFLGDQSKSSTSKVPQPVQKLKQIAESSKALKLQSKQYQLRVRQGPKIK